jgi:hypothetical protein
MQSPDLISEIHLLQQQLESTTKAFDLALKKDVQLGELKSIFHEMKVLQERLNDLQVNMKNENKNG